jgi:hypothetical protein
MVGSRRKHEDVTAAIQAGDPGTGSPAWMHEMWMDPATESPAVGALAPAPRVAASAGYAFGSRTSSSVAQP